MLGGRKGGTRVQLGVVLTGTGVHGAAGIGVLEERAARQTEPCAVCGMGSGAWLAALWASGRETARLREAAAQAAGMGRRLLRPNASARALLSGRRAALCDGTALAHLLGVQTGGRILALCPRRAVFLLRTPRMGLIFSTQSFAVPGGSIMTVQVSAGFAARAAMAMPPFLAPMAWMGGPLLPERDTAAAARALLAMGAQRVLIVKPQPSPRRESDALELAARAMEPEHSALPQGTAVLQVPMPDEAGALNLRAADLCIEAGKKTAERELDRVFEEMGMAFCRILPFRRGD